MRICDTLMAMIFSYVFTKEESAMENVKVETSWEDVNTSECDNASLFDMCSWGEAN